MNESKSYVETVAAPQTNSLSGTNPTMISVHTKKDTSPKQVEQQRMANMGSPDETPPSSSLSVATLEKLRALAVAILNDDNEDKQNNLTSDTQPSYSSNWNRSTPSVSTPSQSSAALSSPTSQSIPIASTTTMGTTNTVNAKRASPNAVG